MRACVRAGMQACRRACVRECVHACLRACDHRFVDHQPNNDVTVVTQWHTLCMFLSQSKQLEPVIRPLDEIYIGSIK